MNLITQWSRHNPIIAFVQQNSHKAQILCKKYEIFASMTKL